MPHFLQLQNGVNELTSIAPTFTFIFTDEKCGVRVGDSGGQGAKNLYGNRIGCIQERGGLELCDDFFCWRLCLK